MEWRTALAGLLRQRDRLMMLYRVAFDFVGPEEGLQSIRQLLSAREAAEVLAEEVLVEEVAHCLPGLRARGPAVLLGGSDMRNWLDDLADGAELSSSRGSLPAPPDHVTTRLRG